MEAEIVALATSGASTLVGLMVTELWTEARGRFASLFGRRSEAVGEELEEVRRELLCADDQAAAAVGAEAEWEARLRRALAADPEAAAQLRALLDELAPHQEPAPAPGSVHNSITGRGVYNEPVIQAGYVQGDVNGRVTGR
ncbi:hypothetical protein AB0D08_25465 [Kitasatospora sp. NPDC048540]|uniref:hypothetical protein n=1 Tax=unclassified Kitasatospora TaxID=2633591 RepID=UPI00053BB876|nr:hypothetical protein [Kitasatospora sp. MBT63]